MAEKRYRDQISDHTSLRKIERDAESIDRSLIQESANRSAQVWPGVIESLDTVYPAQETYTVQLLGGDNHNQPMIAQPGVARPGKYHTSPLTSGTTVAVMILAGRRPFIIPGSDATSGTSGGSTTNWQYVWNEGV